MAEHQTHTHDRNAQDVPGTALSALQTFTQPTWYYQWGYDSYVHFTQGETKASRGRVACRT